MSLKSKTKPPRTRMRNHAGVVTAAFDLLLLLPITVLLALMIVGVTKRTDHEQKFGMVTDQIALYAARLPSNDSLGNFRNKVTIMARDLMDQMELPRRGLATVDADRIVVRNQPAVRIHVFVNQPLIEGTEFYSPNPIEDTAVVLTGTSLIQVAQERHWIRNRNPPEPIYIPIVTMWGPSYDPNYPTYYRDEPAGRDNAPNIPAGPWG